MRPWKIRTVRLRITSARQAPMLWVYVDRQAELVGAAVDGKPIDAATLSASAPPWSLTYWAPPADGFELMLEVRAGTSVDIRVVDRVDGLPEIAGTSFQPRPDTMTSTPTLAIGRLSNATLVSKSFRF